MEEYKGDTMVKWISGDLIAGIVIGIAIGLLFSYMTSGTHLSSVCLECKQLGYLKC
jgi:F0F1-type ATP synthase assembly protein I